MDQKDNIPVPEHDADIGGAWEMYQESASASMVRTLTQWLIFGFSAILVASALAYGSTVFFKNMAARKSPSLIEIEKSRK